MITSLNWRFTDVTTPRRTEMRENGKEDLPLPTSPGLPSGAAGNRVTGCYLVFTDSREAPTFLSAVHPQPGALGRADTADYLVGQAEKVPLLHMVTPVMGCSPPVSPGRAVSKSPGELSASLQPPKTLYTTTRKTRHHFFFFKGQKSINKFVVTNAYTHTKNIPEKDTGERNDMQPKLKNTH